MFLDRVFSNKSRVMILRALANSDEGLTNSDIAEKTGLSEMAVSRNMRKLAKEGLVASKSVGNALVSKLNEENRIGFLVKQLFEWERKSSKGLMKIAEEVLTRGREDIECVVVFGSRARGDEKLDSDLDVLIIKNSDSPRTKTRVIEGIMTSVFELSRGEFINRVKSKDPLVMNVVFEGEVIHGKQKFEEILKKAGL